MPARANRCASGFRGGFHVEFARLKPGLPRSAVWCRKQSGFDQTNIMCSLCYRKRPQMSFASASILLKPPCIGGSSQGGRSPDVCRFVHTTPMDLGLEAPSSRGRGMTVRMWHTGRGEGRVGGCILLGKAVNIITEIHVGGGGGGGGDGAEPTV